MVDKDKYFPQRVWVEDIPVDPFENRQSFIGRVIEEIRSPKQSVIMHLNVYAANIAQQQPSFKALLQKASANFCDGAGIVLAAKLMGDVIPTRHTVADWMVEMVRSVSEAGHSIYFLAGQPGIAESALAEIAKQVPNHNVVGLHHGYILQDAALEAQVIEEINRLQPDLLFVGFGMPLQEFWIDRTRDKLQVNALCSVGAALDYLSNTIARCPRWMGEFGLEWLFRLGLEPKRMFNRYVVGNPWFLSRMALAFVASRLSFGAPAKAPAQ